MGELESTYSALNRKVSLSNQSDVCKPPSTNSNQSSIGIYIDDVSMKQHKELLRSMKTLKQLVEVLSGDIEEETQLLKSKMMPAVLKQGIDSLPDEVLQRILTEDVRSCIESRAQHLQQTCKRFNAIIKSSADCWSRVTNGQNLNNNNIISRIINRKNSPIDILISSDEKHNKSESSKSFRSFFLQYTDRVRNMELELGSGIVNSLIWSRGISFPSLESLKAKGVIYRSIPNWSFPRVLNLDCEVVPSPGLFPLLRNWTLQPGRGFLFQVKMVK